MRELSSRESGRTAEGHLIYPVGWMCRSGKASCKEWYLESWSINRKYSDELIWGKQGKKDILGRKAITVRVTEIRNRIVLLEYNCVFVCVRGGWNTLGIFYPEWLGMRWGCWELCQEKSFCSNLCEMVLCWPKGPYTFFHKIKTHFSFSPRILLIWILEYVGYLPHGIMLIILS